MTHWLNREISQRWQEHWWSFIMRHKDKIVFTELFGHKCITFELAKNNIELFGDDEYRSEILSLTAPFTYILNNPDFNWDWRVISCYNKDVNDDIVLNNLDLPWNWDALCENINITFNLVEKTIDKPWSCEYLSSFNGKDNYGPYAPISFILENPHYEWAWYSITTRPDVTFEIMNEHEHLPWDPRNKVLNPNASKEYVARNYAYNKIVLTCTAHINDVLILEDRNKCNYIWYDILNYYLIARNKHLTLANIEKLYKKFTTQMNEPLYLKTVIMPALTIHPAVTLDYILGHLEMEWAWEYLCSNSNISLDDIIQHPEIERIHKFLNLNNKDYLTIEFVDNNIDEPDWDWEDLSREEFIEEEEAFYLAEYRKHLAAFRIQQWWYRIRLDPRHPVGIRRIEWEYDALFNNHA